MSYDFHFNIHTIFLKWVFIAEQGVSVTVLLLTNNSNRIDDCFLSSSVQGPYPCLGPFIRIVEPESEDLKTKTQKDLG